MSHKLPCHRCAWFGLGRGALTLLLSGLALSLGAADFPLRWRWSNPAPHGHSIVDMAYSPALGLAVQVAERGQLYSSSDLSFWIPRQTGTSLALRGVTFFGNTNPRILVTGENGTVLYADAVDQFQVGTLLTGPTTDWLEAVAASPLLAVAVGDNGAIYASANGAAWARQVPSPPLTEWLRGVAYGGGRFVTVGDGGLVAWSANGTNWTRAPKVTTDHLNRVHYANNRFTAVGEYGRTLSSVDGGVSWQLEQPGAVGDLFDATGTSAARLLLGDEEVRLHEGSGWSNPLTQTNGPPAWVYFSSIALANYFLIGGRTGLMAEGFKTNSAPYFWAQSDDTFRHWLFDLTYATNLYVAVGDRATVLTSGNGIDWTLELVPPTATNAIFLGVGGTTNQLLAAGHDGHLIRSTNQITEVTITNENGVVISNYFTSTLGIIWQSVLPRPTTNDLQGVAYGQGLYVVTGDNGTILTSPEGIAWTPRNAFTSALLSGLTAWPGGLVASGDDGTLVASPDGINWAPLNSGTSNWIYKVRHLGNLLIGVGQNGTILTSADAVKWTLQSSGTTAWLNDVTWVDNTYFVVGTQGTLLSSPEGITWTSRDVITRKSLYGAATDGRQLIVAGLEGSILRSPVVPDLTPIQILDFARIISTNSPNVIQNLYLFGGRTDQQFTLDRRTSLSSNQLWATGPALEFFDSSGTLFYLESMPAAGAPPQSYYEATLSESP